MVGKALEIDSVGQVAHRIIVLVDVYDAVAVLRVRAVRRGIVLLLDVRTGVYRAVPEVDALDRVCLVEGGLPVPVQVPRQHVAVGVRVATAVALQLPVHVELLLVVLVQQRNLLGVLGGLVQFLAVESSLLFSERGSDFIFFDYLRKWSGLRLLGGHLAKIVHFLFLGVPDHRGHVYCIVCVCRSWSEVVRCHLPPQATAGLGGGTYMVKTVVASRAR